MSALSTPSLGSLAAVPLSDASVDSLRERITVPNYDRGLEPSVVHIGVGSFHRSHQAVYFDDLARGGERRWGIVGVGLRSPRMLHALDDQDRLYTVVTRGAEGDCARVVGAITRYLYGPADPAAVLDALCDERTKLVTLTITGGAYAISADTGDFDPARPEVAACLAAGSEPTSALGYIVEALDRRRRAGHLPFTVLSCDNMPRNGEIARNAVTEFASLRDRRLASWIEEYVAFPSSMVDRITPQTRDRDRAFVAREFGVADVWPVMTEPFSQWVIEDSFCNDRPPLEEAGAELVADVEPHALVKTRLLNAAHCALGYLGSLAGHRRTDQAMSDPVFASYIARLMSEEIAPLLPRVPEIDLAAYQRTLIGRLDNPTIRDDLSRLCRAGSAKVPTHVLPSIELARSRVRPHSLLTLAVAGWLTYLRSAGEHARLPAVDDRRGERLRSLALEGGLDPRPLLGEASIFGSLGTDEEFASAVERSMRLIDERGARGAVEATRSDPLRLAA